MTNAKTLAAKWQVCVLVLSLFMLRVQCGVAVWVFCCSFRLQCVLTGIGGIFKNKESGNQMWTVHCRL